MARGRRGWTTYQQAAASLLKTIASGLQRRARLRPDRREPALEQRSNRAARLLVDSFDFLAGRGEEWADHRYGEYYVTSPAVHAAVKVRAEAVARPPTVVYERAGGGSWAPAPPDHPLAALLANPNPYWTPGELWRATETYLLLWGSAFWGIERRGRQVAELWPLRPDRMRVAPDSKRYVRGFVYEHAGGRIAYLPEEVVWFKHFNPLDEFSGLSSVAPPRLAVDMAAQAERFNRNFFSNSATPSDLAVTTEETPTEEEVAQFYERWESRYGGAGRAHRPILLSKGMDAKRLGLSHRDMEFTSGLRWAVEEVARAFGVPKAFLADLSEATFANINAEERFFWRNTIVPELRLLEDEVNRALVPHFGQPGELRAAFDLGAVEALRDNETERVERTVKLVEAGILTIAEARAAWNLPA